MDVSVRTPTLHSMDGEITVDELASLRTDDDRPEPRIVDIRQRPAFERAHIPGSENVPLSQLTTRVTELDDADHVVTVCPHGKASVRAARLIAAYEGFDGHVESLHGGLEAWDGPLADGADPGADDTVADDSRVRDSPADDSPADEGPQAPF
jgi:rhodanese-related sulfurtransferase